MPGPVPPADVPLRPVPLRLASLLQPHRSKGRLALRLERVPQLARLSRGRNNGDGSWSLASDELDELEYLNPEGAELPVIAVRIIGLEQDGATLAVLDFRVTEFSGEPEQRAGADDAYLQRLSAELKAAKAALAARESEIAELRRVDRPQNEFAPITAGLMIRGKDELAAARAAWESEMEKRLTDAAAGAAQSAERQARQWQAEEAERLAAAEAKWKEKFVAELAALTARCEAAERALEQNKRQPSGETKSREKPSAELAALAARCEAAERALEQNKQAQAVRAAEFDRLRDERAALQAKLVETEHARAAAANEVARKLVDTALADAKAGWKAEEAALQARLGQAQKDLDQRAEELARARAALEALQTRAQGDAAAALAKAEAEWRRAETERLTAAETKSNAKSLAEIAALTRRCEAAERALEQNKQAQAVRAGEFDRLRDERAALQAKLVEAEHARAAAANEGARKVAEIALSEARSKWQAEEAERLAQAEARWRGEAKAAHDAELVRLRDEHTAALTKFAEDARAQSAAAGDAVRQQIETALSAAKAAWKSEEAGRLALAENSWRAEAKATHEIELNRLRDENAALRTKLVDGERAHAAASDDALHRQVETALADAKAAWKAEEAARLAAADALWQAKLAEAERSGVAASADTERRVEIALADARAAWQAEEAVRSAAAEAQWQARLAEAGRAAGAASGESVQQQIDKALADAKAAWKSEEAGRIALAEDKARTTAAEKARNEAGAALVRATQRAEAAEAALAQARAGAAGGGYDQAFIDGLHREIESLRRSLADREVELAQAKLTIEARHLIPEGNAATVQTRISLERTPRERDIEPEVVHDPARNRRLVRDIGIVFGVVLVLIFGFPYVVPLLPYDWQVEIYDLETSSGLFGSAPATTAPAATTPAPAPAAPRPAAAPPLSVLRPVNVRKEPATGAAVVTHLKRGDAVIAIETRGNWTHVKTDGGEGWVFSTYLGSAP